MPELVTDPRSDADLVPLDVIAVDFGSVGFGHPLDDLMSAVDGYESRVCVVNPLWRSWRAGRQEFHANVQAAAREIPDRVSGSPVLLGQCAGSAFTIELATVLGASSRPPAALLLVDPLPVTPEMVAREAGELVQRIGGNAEDAAALVADLTGRQHAPDRLSALLDERLRAVARRRVSGLGLDDATAETVVQEIVAWYIDWLCFLAAQPDGFDAVAAPTHLVGEVSAEAWTWIRGLAPDASVTTPGEAPPAVVARLVGSAWANGDQR